MPDNTKYSRTTRNKNQLRQTMNTPKYGVSACNLCDRGRLPDDLSFKVGKYKTCADVHLELSLLKPDSATCTAGQAQYREICCDQKKSLSDYIPSINKPTMAIAAGLFLFWVFTKRIRRRVEQYDDENSDDYHQMDDEETGSNRKKSGKSKQVLEMGGNKKRASTTRSRSKSRDRGRSTRPTAGETKRSKSLRSEKTMKRGHTSRGFSKPATPDDYNTPYPNHEVSSSRYMTDEFHLEDPDTYPPVYQQDDLPYYPDNEQQVEPYYSSEQGFTDGALNDSHYYPPVDPQQLAYYPEEDDGILDYVDEQAADIVYENNYAQGVYSMHHQDDQSTIKTDPMVEFEELETVQGDATVQAVLTQVV